MWALYSLVSAFGWASSDACAKKAMQRGVDDARILFVRYLISVPLLLPLLATGIPGLDHTFWLVHLPWLPLETAAMYLYIRAIRLSPLSLTLPFLALTPLFLILTGGLLLDEEVGPTGVAGIILVVLGSYVVNLGHAQRDLLGPFKAMLREKGTRLMLIVALLYSLTSICGKVLVQHSSPTYFAVHYVVVMTIITALVALRRRGTPPTQQNRALLLGSGCGFALMVLGHMLALHATPVVAYMIAIKRLSGSFGVLYGRLFFSERQLATRLLGSLAMVLGGLLILLD